MPRNTHATMPPPESPKRICFVIAPIGDPNSETRNRTDKVLEHIIKPAAKAVGFAEEDVKHADQLHLPGIITSQIIEQLVDAELVVADLTEHNPNVCYELAIRHAKRKAVVLLIQKGQRIPFDVAPNRVIHYDTADWNSPGQCVDELRQQIDAVLKDPLAAYNPISAAIDFLALRGSSDPFKQIVAELLPRLQSLEVSTQSIQAQLETTRPALQSPVVLPVKMPASEDIAWIRRRSTRDAPELVFDPQVDEPPAG